MENNGNRTLKIGERETKLNQVYPIFNHTDQNEVEIPHFYDRHPWKIGETYRIRVGHIYDLSKFWIILLEQELTVFQNYLNDFYKGKGDPYRIPPEALRRKMYCVAYSDGGYYRGVIVNIPYFASLNPKAVVFLFDFGYIVTITIDKLFYPYKKLYQVPRFAVRACLNRIQPRDNDTWTYKVVRNFSDLVSGKVLLCILESTDVIHRTLYITIGDVDVHSQVNDIGDILVNEKLAKLITPMKSKKGKTYKGRYVSITKYPFLFPSFEALEGGMMPSCVHTLEMLKQCVASQYLLKPYYSIQVFNNNK